MKKRIDYQEVRNFIMSTSKETKIYIGCDSERVPDKNFKGMWNAKYALAIVVHIDGKHGAKIFGEVVTDRDYTPKKNKPSFRLMQEVYRVSEAYMALYDAIGDRHVELHLDINPNPRYASNEVVKQAVGFIKGACDIEPKIKPEAFAASYAADRMVRNV